MLPSGIYRGWIEVEYDVLETGSFDSRDSKARKFFENLAYQIYRNNPGVRAWFHDDTDHFYEVATEHVFTKDTQA